VTNPLTMLSGSDTRVVALRPRSAAAVVLATVGGIMAFGWPLLVSPGSVLTGDSRAPMVFALLLPVVMTVVLLEITEGGLDPKAVAMLGVLAAVGAALRPLGAGTAGLETVFFLLVLAGRVFGPGFGFVLGATTLFASALITGGVGPWLPFQMFGAAWVGMGAGLLPPVPRRWEVLFLASYGAVAGLLYGIVMNLYGWPSGLGVGTALSLVPGDPIWSNLHRFLVYSFSTSLGWDLGRALTNFVLIMVTGKAVLATLRRAARKAAFASLNTQGVAVASMQTGRGVDPGPDQTLHHQGERPGEHDPHQVDAQLRQGTGDL